MVYSCVFSANMCLRFLIVPAGGPRRNMYHITTTVAGAVPTYIIYSNNDFRCMYVSTHLYTAIGFYLLCVSCVRDTFSSKMITFHIYFIQYYPVLRSEVINSPAFTTISLTLCIIEQNIILKL